MPLASRPMSAESSRPGDARRPHGKSCWPLWRTGRRDCALWRAHRVRSRAWWTTAHSASGPHGTARAHQWPSPLMIIRKNLTVLLPNFILSAVILPFLGHRNQHPIYSIQQLTAFFTHSPKRFTVDLFPPAANGHADGAAAVVAVRDFLPRADCGAVSVSPIARS